MIYTIQARENCQPSLYIKTCFNLQVLLGNLQTHMSLYQYLPSFIMCSFICKLSEALSYQTPSEQSPAPSLSYSVRVNSDAVQC